MKQCAPGKMGRAAWEHGAAHRDPSGLTQSFSHDGKPESENEGWAAEAEKESDARTTL